MPSSRTHGIFKEKGTQPGPIFINHNGKPLTRKDFSNILDLCLRRSGFEPKQFGTHSFRIGRCTYMARDGFSEQQIKLVGSWHSDAFKRHIRPQVIHLS